MKEQIIANLRMFFEANINRHKNNIEILLENPRSIPEHTDFHEAIEEELTKMAEWMDKLEALKLID
jgi:hypothetical protein